MNQPSMVRKHRNTGARRTAAKTTHFLHQHSDDDHNDDVELYFTKSRGRITVCAYAFGQPSAN